MTRILVVGPSGSGKTTVARALSGALAAPHVELDALFHGPGWVPRPTFEADVDAATTGPTWVADGNYGPVRELLWARADAVVWLDLPRWQVLGQVTRRSLVRWLRGEVLWHGNREPGPLRWVDPEHPVRWSWSSHPRLRALYGARFDDPAWRGRRLVRLRSRDEVARLLADPRGELG